MTLPFSEYLPKIFDTLEGKFCENGEISESAYLSVETVFHPKIDFRYSMEDMHFVASIGDYSIPLYTAHDLLSWEHDADTENYLKGLIGERVLALMLYTFLSEIASKIPNSNYELMREKGKQRTKRMIANFNDRYIMKFNNTTSLWVLEKSHYDIHPVDRAMEDKFGLRPVCELDGLGFLTHDNQRYVFVGESSAKETDTLLINSWEKSTGRNSPMAHVFEPLMSLYPESSFLYVILAYANQLFDLSTNPPKIKNIPTQITRILEQQGINTILIPFPNGEKTLRELAIEATEYHKMLRRVTSRVYIK